MESNEVVKKVEEHMRVVFKDFPRIIDEDFNHFVDAEFARVDIMMDHVKENLIKLIDISQNDYLDIVSNNNNQLGIEYDSEDF